MGRAWHNSDNNLTKLPVSVSHFEDKKKSALFVLVLKMVAVGKLQVLLEEIDYLDPFLCSFRSLVKALLMHWCEIQQISFQVYE